MPRLVLLAFGLFVLQPGPSLTLEIRTFDGTNEVTSESRITVYRAGDRGAPVGRAGGPAQPPVFTVPPGIYDAQAVQERSSRVVNLRWSERMVVMPYPDEAGHHLQVINLRDGFGALQVRGATGEAPASELALYPAGSRSPASAIRPAAGRSYRLFVVPGGTYDLEVRQPREAVWHEGIEVPRDRTRLWIVP